MSWVAFFSLLFGFSWAGVGLFRYWAVNKGMIDKPNSRSSHHKTTPRGAGIIFVVLALILLGVFVYYKLLTYNYLLLFFPAFCMGYLGYKDDRLNLSSSIRLFFQVLAAAILIIQLGHINFPLFEKWELAYWYVVPIIIFGVVWMTNLYNFMDGSDGLAAIEAIIVLGVGGYFLYQYNVEFAAFIWGGVALVAGFLVWNWPSANIFMGDSGSCFLGFFIATIALISYKLFNISIMPWIIVTALFWFDATITLVRRIFARQNWLQAHKVHAYQRLIQGGWSHLDVLLAATAINAILVMLAVWTYNDPSITKFAFASTMFLLVVAYLIVELIKPMFASWHVIKLAKDKEY